MRIVTSNVSEGDLLRIEKTKDRRMDRPKLLPLSDIHVADEVFQWRNRNRNIAPSIRHQMELIRVLKTIKKPLDAVVVTPIGNKFYLLEGHHRLEAYKAAGWRKLIPVRHFEGSVREARDEALRLNIKDKLPLSREEKFDAAFRMVKQGDKTYERIKDITTVSVRTLATMAKVLREDPTAAKMKSWRSAWWSYFRQQERATEDDEKEGNVDWRDRKAQKLAKQLVKNVGPGFVRDVDITARALEIVDESLPTALVYEWVEQAKAAVVDILREGDPRLADEVVRALIYTTAGEFGDAGDL